jgi:hypothetical protein
VVIGRLLGKVVGTVVALPAIAVNEAEAALDEANRRLDAVLDKAEGRKS